MTWEAQECSPNHPIFPERHVGHRLPGGKSVVHEIEQILSHLNAPGAKMTRFSPGIGTCSFTEHPSHIGKMIPIWTVKIQPPNAELTIKTWWTYMIIWWSYMNLVGWLISSVPQRLEQRARHRSTELSQKSFDDSSRKVCTSHLGFFFEQSIINNQYQYIFFNFVLSCILKQLWSQRSEYMTYVKSRSSSRAFFCFDGVRKSNLQVHAKHLGG